MFLASDCCGSFIRRLLKRSKHEIPSLSFRVTSIVPRETSLVNYRGLCSCLLLERVQVNEPQRNSDRQGDVQDDRDEGDADASPLTFDEAIEFLEGPAPRL